MDIWLEEEARAERHANRYRIIMLAIWLIAITPAISIHPPSANVGNVGFGFAYLLIALMYARYLATHPYHPALKFISTTGDVVLTIAILFSYHYDMGYSTSLKAPPFMNFILMLGLTALRFNVLLPLYGTALAGLAYVALFGYLALTQDVEYGSPLEMFTTEKISLVYQGYRLAFLLALAVLTSVLANNVRRLVGERVEEIARRQQFERYFTPEIAQYLVQNPQDLGGKLQPVTVIVTDLRGFTTLSEKIGPVASVAMLNDLFDKLVNAVFEYGGTLDKFMGDGMLVVFGTPQPKADDPVRAIECARTMTAIVRQTNPSLKLGIAIHSGEVIFGNIGSARRMELTVIGDTVNTVSRIEPLNKIYNTTILVSKRTADNVRDRFDLQFVAEAELRGKDEKIALYTIAENVSN